MKVLVVASEVGCPERVTDAGSPRRFVEIDRAPVEEALRLRDNGGADEVVVVSVGDLKARILLRLALGMGADRAVLIDSEGGRSAQETSRLLAALAARERPDLILLGASAGALLASISSSSAGGSATLRVSELAQGACRYPTLMKTRGATAKKWDIMPAAALLPADKPPSIAGALGIEKLMRLANMEHREKGATDEILEDARSRIAKQTGLPPDRVKLEVRFVAD
ncbi:MAG TPA: hypothetical protein VK430_01245 [Xanthobacteraceae bacterium]|nr:hypothetical protein [Xanthobacteraceae bacterium]